MGMLQTLREQVMLGVDDKVFDFNSIYGRQPVHYELKTIHEDVIESVSELYELSECQFELLRSTSVVDMRNTFVEWD